MASGFLYTSLGFYVAWVVFGILAASGTEEVRNASADNHVEIRMNGEWRPLIVDGDLSSPSTRVLCRSMGLPADDVTAVRLKYLPIPGSPTPVNLECHCQGHELNIAQCTPMILREDLYANSSSTTVALTCLGLNMELVGGTNHSGALVVTQGSDRVPVCQKVDSLSPKVVCTHLGLPRDRCEHANPTATVWVCGDNETDKSRKPRLGALRSSPTHSVYTDPFQFIPLVNISRTVSLTAICPDNNTSELCEVHTAADWNCPILLSAYNFVFVKGVICTDTAPEYRLTSVQNTTIGILEAKLEGGWGPVCAKSQEYLVAEVACRTLGLPSTDARSYEGIFNWGTSKTAIQFLFCSEGDVTLNDCHVYWQGQCSNGNLLGLQCLHAYPGKVRLSDIDGGAVEVYNNNTWAGVSVMPQMSGHEVATVICRSLNLSTSAVRYTLSKVNTSLWLPAVSCLGNEANLLDCSGTDLDSVVEKVTGRRLFVHCDMNDEAVRLGEDGLLELRHNGRWGTVCAGTLNGDTVFRNVDAARVCSSLNKSSSLASFSFKPNKAERSGIVMADNLKCDRLSKTWKDCQHGDWRNAMCGHDRDIFISCQELNRQDVKYRLSSGFRNAGLYEMSINGVWGTVGYALTYGRNEVAQTLCRSLGKRTDGARIVQSEYFPPAASDQKWFDMFGCDGGSPDTPLDCSHTYLGDASPGPGVAVYCGAPSEWTDFSLRLVDGPDKFMGRLEVMIFGEWGTVCDKGFGSKATQIVCLQLGFSSENARILKRGTFNGTGRILLSSVDDCLTRRSTGFTMCSYRSIGQTGCDHSRDVSIQCQKPDTFAPSLYTDDLGSGRKVGLIVGCAVGGVALGVFLVVLAVYVRHRIRMNESRSASAGVVMGTQVHYLPPVLTTTRTQIAKPYPYPAGYDVQYTSNNEPPATLRKKN